MAIKVYVANIKNKTLEQIMRDYQDYLKDEDIMKASRFKMDLNQKQSLMSSALKRKMVPGTITYNEHGKPLSDACFFNVSHSADLVVLAISYKYLIGVDIEYINSKTSDDLINYVCSEEELSFIKDSKYQKFYYLWTRKEALQKCIGVGLVHDLKAINGLTSQSGYQLFSEILGEYVLSLAIQSEASDMKIEIVKENGYE